MPVIAQATGTQTATVTTEHVLADVAVTGVFQLIVDTVNLADGDVLELRVYQIVLTGGTGRVVLQGLFYGAQPTTDLIKTSVPVVNDLTDSQSLRFTLTQAFGSSRSFPWKVVKVAS